MRQEADEKEASHFSLVIDTCSVNMMQIATVLICASCERVVVTIGEGSWKRVVDESHSLKRVTFTTVVLCWQCGLTQPTCPVRGIGRLMTAQLFADSPALDTDASSFAPGADGIFWHAYVDDPPRESVFGASIPPLGKTRLPIVGISRIEEGLVGKYQYVGRENTGDCGDFFSSDMTE